MDNLMLLIIGIVISVIGIVNIKGNISTVHSYNRRKVSEEDVPKYGKAVGTGTLIIGVSLVIAYFTTFWSMTIMGFIVITGIVIGLSFILYAQIKYNHGIFWIWQFKQIHIWGINYKDYFSIYGRVYTVEGNSENLIRQNSYPVEYYEILGYGVPQY